jgi:transporter family-2 protein
VSGGTGLAAVLALFAGLAGSVQAAVMGRFGERIGLVEALAWVTLLSAVLAFAALLVSRRGLGDLADAWSAPKWLWLGAFLGTFVVFTITLASPRIGTAATIGLLVAGQLAAGAVIDRYGLFGFERIALTWPRALGIALLAAGALLTLKR